jgi:PAS domain S-box-containing protein
MNELTSSLGAGILPDFRALFENTPNLYLVLDPDLVIVAVNDAYCAATMTMREQIVFRRLFDVFPDNPDDTAADGVSNLRASLTRVLRNRRPDLMPTQRYDIPRPDGGFEERFWSPLNTPVLGQHGEVRWILHRVDDVTEQVRSRAKEADAEQIIAQLTATNAELARRNRENLELSSGRAKAEALTVGLMLASPDAVMAVDAAGRIVLASDRFRPMYGYAPADLVGQPATILIPPEEREAQSARAREVLASGSGTIEDIMGLRRDGTTFPVEASLSGYRSDDGPLVVIALRDISDRKAVEDQLRQAQKMEAIGSLTGGIAHDFNNLLSVVIGNLDLLREDLGGHPIADGLAAEALEAALRGAELTKRLLAFARRQPLQPRVVDVNDLVAGISRLLSRTVGGNVQVRLQPGYGVAPVTVDPAQLENCLVNLVVNARDAMPGGGELTISTDNRHLDADYVGMHPGLAAGDYTLIEVADTGAGMPSDVMEKIFEPFFTTKREGKGTGLGLAMVFGFMKQSGGHINVYSEVGVGTTFRLYLPQAVGAAGATVAGEAGAVHGGPETVLAVEDNPGLRALVVKQLTGLGYRCFEAENGPAALAILERETVDLLFTDVIMPGGMSGYELGREAKSRWPAIKVLLTSGFPEEKINGNAQPPWNMRLLIKPYRKEDLARTLREVLAEPD